MRNAIGRRLYLLLKTRMAQGTSSWITILGIACVLTPGLANAKDLFIYKERDGTQWITDHWLPSDKYAYIGKYGRPTAVLSCRGLRKGDLEARASKYAGYIVKHADAYKVDPLLVKAVMRVESCFDAKAVSRVGAQGLMQLMPFTARELGVINSFDPDQNIRGGVLYLSRMLKRFSNNRSLALAAYNAGPGAVSKYNGVPPYRETKSYLKKVLAQYERYRTASN